MVTTTKYDDATKQNIQEPISEKRRLATVYDAIAGRIGVNGFLSTEERQTRSVKPSRPEEVLLRRVDAPREIPFNYYNADENLGAKEGPLPDGELLKDIHEYVADFYEATSEAVFDFRSFDESALLAMGILLEEASKEALGESGDMVFSEPQSTDRSLPESRLTRYQVIGKVVPRDVQEYHSASDEDDPETSEMPTRARKRRRYQREEEEA